MGRDSVDGVGCGELIVMSRHKALLPLLLWLGLVLLVVWAWVQFGASSLTTVLTMVSTLVALLPILKVGPLDWSVPGRPSTSAQVDLAAEALATEVRKQWDEEARRRRLQERRQMPVRWEVEDRPSKGDPLPGAGEISTLVNQFAGRPRPMIVIGEPGSGKTGLCVLLTLDLLNEASRHRVPILLQVSSWDPGENLDNWLARRLLEDYPFLGNDARFGATVAEEIVAQRRVIPILDGLDEMPAELQPKALKAIEDDWSSSRPFVLTCRADEFHAADAQNLMAGVLIVRLLPLDAQAATNYLLAGAPDASLEQWEPVLADIVERPAGPLGTTLTKPLMLFLTRVTYEEAGRSPDELVVRERFQGALDVEEHLLDQFIPTVFQTRPQRRLPNPTRPSRLWPPAQAEGVLTFLAQYLQTGGTRDFAWWQLHRAVPPMASHLVRVVVGTLCCGLLGWLMFGLYGRPVLGVVFGLSVGFLGALPLGAIQEKRPRRFVPRILRRSELAPEFLVRDIGFGIVGAVVGGLVVGLLYGVGHAVVIGLVFGLAFGIVRRFTEPTEPKEPVSPLGVLGSDRSTVLYAAVLGGLTGTVVGAFLGGVIGARDRGFVIDVGPIGQGALSAGLGLLMGAGGLGMMVHATSAWAQFLMARIWLGVRGQTPFRLMTFLDDAHKLGVLRQIGPHYQFRHALLQDRLAERAASA
jgi:NACHT domain